MINLTASLGMKLSILHKWETFQRFFLFFSRVSLFKNALGINYDFFPLGLGWKNFNAGRVKNKTVKKVLRIHSLRCFRVIPFSALYVFPYCDIFFNIIQYYGVVILFSCCYQKYHLN
jgi:hypothetical protein